MYKLITTVIISLFITNCSISQVLTKKYFTKDHVQTEKIEEAYYYQEISKDPSGKLFEVVEKYIVNDNIKLIGTSTSAEFTHYVGERREYHENGVLSSEMTFSFDNKAIDTAKYFYTNGVQKLKMYFPYETQNNFTIINDTLIFSYVDTLGISRIENGNGHALIDVFGDISKGNVINYKRDGDWEGKLKHLDYTFTETYKNGKFIDGISIDKSGKVYQYNSIEVVPEYPDGIHGLRKFIGENYNYPRAAIKKKIKGTVKITFVVEKDGNVTDIKIVEDIGYGTGQAAIDVLKKSKKWTPGLQRGVPVRVAYALPIRLDLSKM